MGADVLTPYWEPMDDFTEVVNPSLAKLPLNFNGSLAKHELPSSL